MANGLLGNLQPNGLLGPVTMNPNIAAQGRNALAATLRGTPKNALLDPEFYSRDLGPSAARYFSEPENSLRALSLAPVPVLSDVAGLAADALMYKNKPEERNLLNFGLTGLGALPFLPAMAGAMKLKDLPLEKTAYQAVSKGSQGQEILYNGQPVGLVQGKLSNAVDTFLAELQKAKQSSAARSVAAKSGAMTKVQNAQSAKVTQTALEQYADVIANAHKNPELTFQAIDNAAFNSPSAALVYQSPNYGNKPGSAYKIIDVGGRPAYARQSDHWGSFHTNDFVNGEPVSRKFNWQLPGVSTNYVSKDRYTGYVFLDDLIKKPPK